MASNGPTRRSVFTEYRDTQLWLVNLLRQEGLAGDRLAELHAGISPDNRDAAASGVSEAPHGAPVRILLATDAASEGIDLQRHCHRLVNYDIPFNPNKLEQRIGRIDRYGQTETRTSATSLAPVGKAQLAPTKRTWSFLAGWQRRSPTWRLISDR